MSSKSLSVLLLTLIGCVLCTGSQAQEDLSTHWEGDWVAEGTLFRIGVALENEELIISQIESMGFLWTSGNGKIDGNIVTVEVEYAGAGVAGTIQAELVNPTTAVAFAATCLPDFMVVCLLAKGQQAVFRKVVENQPLDIGH